MIDSRGGTSTWLHFSETFSEVAIASSITSVQGDAMRIATPLAWKTSHNSAITALIACVSPALLSLVGVRRRYLDSHELRAMTFISMQHIVHSCEVSCRPASELISAEGVHDTSQLKMRVPTHTSLIETDAMLPFQALASELASCYLHASGRLFSTTTTRLGQSVYCLRFWGSCFGGCSVPQLLWCFVVRVAALFSSACLSCSLRESSSSRPLLKSSSRFRS